MTRATTPVLRHRLRLLAQLLLLAAVHAGEKYVHDPRKKRKESSGAGVLGQAPVWDSDAEGQLDGFFLPFFLAIFAIGAVRLLAHCAFGRRDDAQEDQPGAGVRTSAS